MTPQTKRVVAGIVLTLAPILSVQGALQSSWGKFLATPKARQIGDAHAPVVLVEYSDFQCPMCAHMQPVLQQFLDIYKGKVRLAYKYFPLTKIHKNAMAAARAAECAADQNQFWPYHDRLFQSQPQWAPLADPTTTYMALARDLSIDTTKFSSCLSDPSKEAVVEADHAEGQARQINATPTLFVGNERLVGTYIETDGARMIDRELRK